MMFRRALAKLLGQKYDIFLSFKGESYIRERFIDHLYYQLMDAKFSVFKDDVNLQVGEYIAPSILKAITNSRILMPVFSKNYAASEWCMAELVYMMECSKLLGLKVVPIFYDVTPHQVRRQTESYKTAFLEHSKNYDFAKVRKWKETLAEVASIKGLKLAGKEGEFTRLIVKEVRVSKRSMTKQIFVKLSRKLRGKTAKLKKSLEDLQNQLAHELSMEGAQSREGTKNQPADELSMERGACLEVEDDLEDDDTHLLLAGYTG